jgi:UDP-N-acetylmuramate dehydrogenase
MSAAVAFDNDLLSRLPPVRGRYTANAVLGPMTWFGVGGPAEVLFKPADADDLASFIAACPKDIPVTPLGVASNLIIRDGGIPGVVIRFGREFAAITHEGDIVAAGAAALDVNVAEYACRTGLGGLAFLCGIPGTIGGALRMNAGAYGGEIKDILETARVLFPDGTVKDMTASDMGLSYRHNAVDKKAIFLSARLKGKKTDSAQIEQQMADIKAKRAATQPIKSKTGGSTFANPDGHKAWELIDRAGCRGLKIGGAEVSTQHCNFLLNTGGATAADIERLGENVRARVAETSGVMLRWEIKRIGVPLPSDTDILGFMRDADA